MFKTIQSVLFAAFVGIVILSFIVFALLATPRIRAATINQVANELQKQMALATDDFSAALQAGQSQARLQSLVLRLSKASQSRITLIAADGRVLADSATPLDKLSQLENHADRPEIRQAAAKGTGRAVRYSTTVEKDFIYTAVPLRDSRDRTLAYLRFSVPATYAAELVMKIHKSMLVALVLAILVAITLSVLFARTFSRPIIRLAGVSKRIAGGEFPQTILRRSRFEVGKLEEAVEQMSRRLAESFNKLAAERGRAAAILSSMSEGVLAADEQGRVIRANPVIEQVFGVTEPEILGRTVREAVRNNDVAEIMEEAAASRRIISRELNLVTPVEGIFSAHAGPIRDPRGEVIGVVCVLYQITELRRLEKHRSEFVANVSHELKTPLTAIRNYIETLLAGAVDDRQNNREFLGKIDKHAHNLSALIDDILEISRLETRKELGPFNPVDLGRTIRKAVETIQSKASKKNVKLEACCAEKECLIPGMEEHIYRAILNLLDNAVNYTENGGKVTIVCVKEADRVKVTVADTGCGIPAEHLPRIFERFYRVDLARSRELGGTGLGLAIVKHVMNLHHGSVSVESEEGKGSAFTLVFPL